MPKNATQNDQHLRLATADYIRNLLIKNNVNMDKAHLLCSYVPKYSKMKQKKHTLYIKCVLMWLYK